VWRSAISVIADWPIFLSLKYRNAPYKKNYFIFESLDVAFRYSRYSGLTHQNVKIKAMCTVHISQIFPFEYWGIFSMPLRTPPPPPLRFQKILELLRKYSIKLGMIITRPTPVLRKIHKMGAPLFSFQPRTPHDPVTPHEKVCISSNRFFVF
jgi:hypothetical protein